MKLLIPRRKRGTSLLAVLVLLAVECAPALASQLNKSSLTQSRTPGKACRCCHHHAPRRRPVDEGRVVEECVKWGSDVMQAMMIQGGTMEERLWSKTAESLIREGRSREALPILANLSRESLQSLQRNFSQDSKPLRPTTPLLPSVFFLHKPFVSTIAPFDRHDCPQGIPSGVC